MTQERSVEKQLFPGSSSLYFFFGGIGAGIGLPPFEFFSAAKIVNENKIFLRDFTQAWYHAGLRDLSTSIDATSEYIRQCIDETKPETTYFIGNSMGGYAAILFHALLGTGRAIAFSPQTFICSELREKHRDNRWAKQIARTQTLPTAKPEAFNLADVLQGKSDLDIAIYVATDDRLDYAHAQMISGHTGVEIHEFTSGGHNLVKELRNLNLLDDILAGKYDPNERSETS